MDTDRFEFEFVYSFCLWGQVIWFLGASTGKWTSEPIIYWKCLVQRLTPRVCFINAKVPVPSLILFALLDSREFYPRLEFIYLQFSFLTHAYCWCLNCTCSDYFPIWIRLTLVLQAFPLSFSYLPLVACWWHSDIWAGSVCSCGLDFPLPVPGQQDLRSSDAEALSCLSLQCS